MGTFRAEAFSGVQGDARGISCKDPDTAPLLQLTKTDDEPPKLAPLTHANICTAADDIRMAVALDASEG